MCQIDQPNRRFRCMMSILPCPIELLGLLGLPSCIYNVVSSLLMCLYTAEMWWLGTFSFFNFGFFREFYPVCFLLVSVCMLVFGEVGK